MREIEKVAVVIPARNESESFRDGFLGQVFNHLPLDCEQKLMIAINNSEPDLANELVGQDPRIVPLQLGSLTPRTFAYAYLSGLQLAVEEVGADYVVEMDATGAHDPKYLSDFISRLREGADAALSSRFMSDGGVSRYPLQRKALSRFGTMVANLVLGLGAGYISDMTSGYEAFRREVLQDVFKKAPIDEWISVIGKPARFYQTEMRARVFWRGNEVEMVPIVWGTDRAKDPTTLPLRTALQAFGSLIPLRRERKDDRRS